MKLNFLWTILAFWLISFVSIIAQPSAEIISSDVSICENGEVDLVIQFTGDSPFGLLYKVENIELGSSTTYSILKQSDALFEGTHVISGVWTETLSFAYTSRITIIEVFDNSISTHPSADGPTWWAGEGSDQVSGEMTITVDRTPTPDAGLFTPQCGYVAPLNATLSDPDNNTMYWTDVTGGSFTDKTIPNPSFIAETQGTYILTLTEVSGVCEASDNITIELYGSPQSLLSGSQIICSNDGNDYTLNVTTEISNGTAPYNYKITNGTTEYPRNGIAATDNFTIPATEETTWTVMEVFDARGCEAHVDSIKGEATVMDNKPNANAGVADNWCEDDLGSGYTLNAQLDKSEGGKWLAHTDIAFSNPNDPNAVATANNFGTYTLIWEESYNGCSETSTVDITFINPPTLAFAMKEDTAICEQGDAVLRTLTTSEYYPLTLSYSDEADQITTISSDYTETILNPNALGLNTYQLTKLTDNRDCFSDLTDQFNVTVDFVPDPDPGDYEPVCGHLINLSARPFDNESGLWSQLTSGGVFSDPSSPNSTFSIDPDYQDTKETHTLQWRVENINNTNCVATEAVDIVFDKQPVNVFAGRDTTIYETDQLELNATGREEGMDGLWSSSSGNVIFSNPTEPNIIASNIPEGQNELIWTVMNGVCDDVVSIMNLLRKPLTNPNGFSPNGDEINDTFIIGGADQINGNKFTVFDMNGKVVYQKENLGSEGWNGVGLDGTKLPNGTYYYIFTGEGVTKKEYLIIKGRN